MLSSHAYSFRQQSRLAISLSWVGGYVNVIALIAFASVISHQTGNTTWLGRLMVGQGDRGTETICRVGSLVFTFFLGAAASGYMTGKADRRGVSSRYVAPIAAEAMMLLLLWLGLTMWIYRHGPPTTASLPPFWMLPLGSFAMGLQNATITKVSGSVVRTTHLTGVVTDLGLEGMQYLLWWRDMTRGSRPDRLGRVLRISRRHPSAQRVLLLASIFGSFLFGAGAGAIAFHALPRLALLAPVSFLIWMIWVDWRAPIGAVTELDVMSDPELRLYGIVKTLLPPTLGIYRLSHHRKGKDFAHEAPNFQLWIKRLPAQWRVIILAVNPLTRFDSESVTDLRAALQKLRAEHKRLILSGVNPSQYKLMDALRLTDVLDVEDFCPDLEFAIARAIEVNRA